VPAVFQNSPRQTSTITWRKARSGGLQTTVWGRGRA
jgi:hypothetical protein